MGNVFKSMALAVALAAGGTNVKAEGGLDTRVMKTKEALAELLGSLDPVTYGKAMEVLQGDLGLLTDGRLDPTDEPTIIDHMGKLAKLFPEETDKVLKAMNEVDTVVALNEVAPLNESPEERKERLDRERLEKVRDDSIKEFNKDILEEDKWSSLKIGSSNNNNDADAVIDRYKGGLKFSMKQKNGTFAQAFFHKEFLAGKYTIVLEGSDGKYVIYWPGGKDIIVKPGIATTFEITENKQISFSALPDRITPEITVSKITIEKAAPEIADNK